MRKAIVGLVALALLLVIAGCGSASTAATPSAEAQFCQNLAQLHGTVTQLTQVNGNTTIGQAKSDQQAVSDAFSQVKKSAANVHNARVSDLNAAVNSLRQTINTLPNSTTLNEAAATVKSQAANVQSTAAQLGTRVNCQMPAATP